MPQTEWVEVRIEGDDATYRIRRPSFATQRIVANKLGQASEQERAFELVKLSMQVAVADTGAWRAVTDNEFGLFDDTTFEPFRLAMNNLQKPDQRLVALIQELRAALPDDTTPEAVSMLDAISAAALERLGAANPKA